MNDCHAIREMLVLHAERSLGPEESGRVEAHLRLCSGCREEQAQILEIRGWLLDPELFGPEQDMAWQLLPERLAMRAAPGSGARRGRASWRPALWITGLAALLFAVAAGRIWLLPPRGSAPTVAGPAVPSGNEEFLGKVRAVYAREATAQYLRGCHDLLLDVASAEKKCDAGGFDVSLEVARARRLLQQKRMLDAEPVIPETVHARGLCDDLEQFLLNLSTAQECETGDALRTMERFIESEQLLLRIRVIGSGIS